MFDEHTIRTHMVGVCLNKDEAARIDADARALGLSRAETVRRACPKYFQEPVKQGRIPRVSPWRRTASG